MVKCKVGVLVLVWLTRGEAGEAVAGRSVWVHSGAQLDVEPIIEHLAYKFGSVGDGAHMICAVVLDQGDGQEGGAVADCGVRLHSCTLLDVEPFREHFPHKFGNMADVEEGVGV